MEHVIKLCEEKFNDLKKGKIKRDYYFKDDKKLVRVKDTIKYLKLPNLDEEYIVDVTGIEEFASLSDCYEKYYDEDLKDRYDSIENLIKEIMVSSDYPNGELSKKPALVFSIKKHRIIHYNATACYLKKDSQVLMIKFTKKWGQVYAPPGGKFEKGETPLDCIMREFYEETGLTLINPRLQGISYWQDQDEGMIFIFIAEDFTGNLKEVSEEGKLEWVKLTDLPKIKQFEQNTIFTPYLFKKAIFEGKFLLDSKCQVLKYEIRKI